MTPEELAMMKKHKKHGGPRRRRRAAEASDGEDWGAAAKLHEYGIEQVADLNDPHLVDAHMLTDERHD